MPPPALPWTLPLGVPGGLIERFRVPPFLLPIYQAAGTEYGIPWQVLAAINEIETDYGRNLNVSSAGAMGWMQFLPSSWRAYGVDANGDGVKGPYNPADAIFAAARYLAAAGASEDLRGAIFAYNHANWYVESVLLRAELIGGVPAQLVDTVTALAQGRFPVAGRATSLSRPAPGAGNAGVDIHARPGAPVVAAQDGVVKAIGSSRRRGRYLVLQDAYGNTYSYGRLGHVARTYPVPKEAASEPWSPPRLRADALPADGRPASAGSQPGTHSWPIATPSRPGLKRRQFANPWFPAAYRNGGREQLLAASVGEAIAGADVSIPAGLGLPRDEIELRPLRPGARVLAGTVLGRLPRDAGPRPRLRFSLRPSGKRARPIDPRPILNGWRLLEQTAVYRTKTSKGLFGGERPTIGQLLLMGRAQLARHVLADRRVEIYSCGRRDVRSGLIDRRVLAVLAFLSSSGLHPRVSSLTCGHSYLTSAGNVSAHSSGSAVDISAVNGIPIDGNQGPSSITERTIRRLLQLQGLLQPDQVISLMRFPEAHNTLAMQDHGDHIHVGFRPLHAPPGQRAAALLSPTQWTSLAEQLGRIENPIVPPDSLAGPGR